MKIWWRFQKTGLMLSDERLQVLARELFAGSAEFDIESRMLRSSNRNPPTLAGIPPPPFKRRTEPPPKLKLLPAAPGASAKPKPRPGWLGGWI